MFKIEESIKKINSKNKKLQLSLKKEILKEPNFQFNNDKISSDIVTFRDVKINCDEHFARSKMSVEALKFCNKCIKYLCYECIIMFHQDHIKSAIYSLEESINLKDKEIFALYNDINKLNETFISKDMNCKFPEKLKCIKNESLKFIQELILLKNSIESLINWEKDYLDKITLICKEYFNRKLGYQIKRFENGINDIKKISGLLIEDWKKVDLSTKRDLIKDCMIENLNDEYEDLKEIMTSINSEKIKLFSVLDEGLSKLHTNIISSKKFKELLNNFDDLVCKIKNNSNEVSLEIFKSEIKKKDICKVVPQTTLKSIKKKSKKKFHNLLNQSLNYWRDTCELCEDYGDLLKCEKCPFVAHLSCLKLEKVPSYFLCRDCYL